MTQPNINISSVTAAGICPDEPFLQRDPKSVARTFDININGTFYAAQLAAAQMVKQEATKANSRGGSIVLIASIAAHVASKGQTTSDYCSSKGAVVSLAKALGVELAAFGIRVNSISPGYVRFCLFDVHDFGPSFFAWRHTETHHSYMLTDMTNDIAARYPWLGDIMRNEPPMRRIGDRTDLKAPVVYLLSNASAYHTSDDILITGGIHAGRLM